MSDNHAVRAMLGLDRRQDRTAAVEAGLPFATAHPSSVPTGYAQFRTDLGLIEYYDGTRWITVEKWAIPLLPNRSTVAVNTIWDTRVRTDYALYVEAFAISTNVAAPNSAVSFWTVTCQGVNLALSAATTVFNPNTSGDAAATEVDHGGSVAAANVAPSNNAYLRVSVNKGGATGTPGNLTVAVTAYTRMIIP